MKTRALLALSLFATASMPLALAAQQISTPAETRLDEVNLEGGQGGGLAGTAPVGLVSGSDIEKSQAGTVANALREIPGVTIARGDNLLSAGIAIRGFGGGYVMPSDPNVIVNVDGASGEGGANYRNGSGMIVDPALIKTLRVYKGQLNSLEFGSGIAAGTVEAETINGSDLTGGQVGVRLRQMLGANSNGSGWVTSSTLAWQPTQNADFLVNYTRRRLGDQKDGNGKIIGDQGYLGYNMPALLLKARYRFGEDHTLSFSYTKSESSERDVPYGQVYNAAMAKVNRDRDGTVAAITWGYNPAGSDLIDLEVKYSISRQQMHMTPVDPNDRLAAVFAQKYDLDTNRLTIKNNARFTTGNVTHNLRFGAEYSKQWRDTPLAGLASAGRDQRVALFAIDQMDFGNQLRMTAGLRLERQDLDQAKLPTGVAVGPFKNNAVTAGLGIEKGFGEHFAAFGSVSYGEGLPTVDAVRINSNVTGRNLAADVRKTVMLEAGLRFGGTDLFSAGDRLSGSVTVYSIRQRNPHDLAQGANIRAYDNKGIELQASYQRADGIYGRASAALFDNNQRTATSQAWEDYTYSATSNASLTVGKRWGNGLDTSWSVRAAKGGLDGSSAKRYVPGYGVHDILVNYTPTTGYLAGATISLGVENVFDKTYRPNIASYSDPGRNFKLTVAKTF